MAASGYSILAIASIPATDNVENVVANKQGITLRQASRVRVFLSREDVDVLAGINIGGTQVLETGAPTPLNATVGVMPSIQDDMVVEVFARQNDLIIISGTNSNAGAKELRVLVQIMPLDDVLISSAIRMRRSA